MVRRLFKHMHPGVTLLRVLMATERFHAGLPSSGICIHCGCNTDRCPPEARGIECWVCGHDTVYGAEELLSELVPNDNRKREVKP